jgi:TPR repeat protein
MMGEAYESGSGVSKNLKEAVKWYRLAADQGHDDAQEALERLGL